MKRALIAVLLALLPALASAQDNGSIIRYYPPSGGASAGGSNAFTGTNSFIDANFSLLDDADPTKVAKFQLSAIGSGLTRTFTLPNVDGTLFTSGGTNIQLTNTHFFLGVNSGNGLIWSTAQTPDVGFLETGTAANAWLIAEGADVNFDFAHPLQTNPTLFIHSANQSTTQWLSLTHTGTRAEVATGTGGLSLVNAGESVLHIAANSVSTQSDAFIGWSTNATDAGTGFDTRFKRRSAAVIQVADGSGNGSSLLGGGTAVASADPLPVPTGIVFHVTGTTNFTNITVTGLISGVCFTMIFDGILTVTDGGNLRLAGNFVTTADDTLTVCFDGTNYYETARAVN